MAGQVQKWFDPRETAIRRARDILNHAMRYKVLMQHEQASQVKEYAQELELTPEEQHLLRRSLRKYYRGVWIRRGVVAMITLFAIIATILGRYAYIQKEQALIAQQNETEQRKQAEQARQEAEKREKEALRQLVKNYWDNGVNERDKNNDYLKAAHYFMKAASLTEDPAFLKTAQLAGGNILERSLHLVRGILTHDASVSGAAFSSDDRRVLTWSDDGTARIWEVASGQAVTPPLPHQEGVRGARFSKDDQRVLTWSNDGAVRLWDSETGEPLVPPMKHNEAVYSAVFSK